MATQNDKVNEQLPPLGRILAVLDEHLPKEGHGLSDEWLGRAFAFPEHVWLELRDHLRRHRASERFRPDSPLADRLDNFATTLRRGGPVGSLTMADLLHEASDAVRAARPVVDHDFREVDEHPADQAVEAQLRIALRVIQESTESACATVRKAQEDVEKHLARLTYATVDEPATFTMARTAHLEPGQKLDEPAPVTPVAEVVDRLDGMLAHVMLSGHEYNVETLEQAREWLVRLGQAPLWGAPQVTIALDQAERDGLVQRVEEVEGRPVFATVESRPDNPEPGVQVGAGEPPMDPETVRGILNTRVSDRGLEFAIQALSGKADRIAGRVPSNPNGGPFRAPSFADGVERAACWLEDADWSGSGISQAQVRALCDNMRAQVRPA